MAIVRITKTLEKEINRIFKKESATIFRLMLTLEVNPKKGKEVGAVGNTTIKELKYRNYRFYFITDKHKIKFLSAEELTQLLLKFIRMSDKKQQQKTIDEIKTVLRNLGSDGF